MGLAKSNGSLRQVYDSRYLQADCQNRDQLRNPMLGNRVWATITLFRAIVVLYEISLTAEWLCETALVFFLYWFSF